MTYAIFTTRLYSTVRAAIVEVDDENDEFIAWYREYIKCETVIIVHGPISVPESYADRVRFTTKAEQMEF